MEVGPLADSFARISLDVLVPGRGDIPTALDQARSEARSSGLALVDRLAEHVDRMAVTVELVSLDDLGWHHRLPGYVYCAIDRDDFTLVDRSPGVVRIDARGPARPHRP